MNLQITNSDYDLENQNFENWTQEHLNLLNTTINKLNDLSVNEYKYKYILINLIVSYIKWCKNNNKDIYDLIYPSLNNEITIVNTNNNGNNDINVNNNNELRNTLHNLGLIQHESVRYRRTSNTHYNSETCVCTSVFILIVMIIVFVTSI